MFSDRCLVVRVQCSVFLSQTGGMDALKNGDVDTILKKIMTLPQVSILRGA